MCKHYVSLDNWHNDLHSLFGGCNLLKMCILPKFLYQFQALPIKIPLTYFRQIHYLFIKLIWAIYYLYHKIWWPSPS